MAVPVHLKGEGHLVLQYGRNLPIPIPDLHVDENGVSATLSFARSPHRTVVPWSAVYVIASEDGRGVLYNEDVPRDVSVVAGSADPNDRNIKAPSSDPSGGEVTAAGPADGTVDGDGADLGSRPTPTRALRAVPMGAALEDAEFGMLEDARDVLPARRRRRPQLRLVK